ncbi:interleukin-18 receptor accessory protein-like isoform X1 [Chiloscyllium plagiosum]|uniref:interleukin-18 receptor accessory protein-like isoform X1 n=2 Tax=Chiloscyllium plagiosum TaxID=36176 RepID=UPI001CB7DD4F|nr:interleukin-18 receptor accessory protein-like isoform X1 [Chiloscyllium plagiosum]
MGKKQALMNVRNDSASGGKTTEMRIWNFWILFFTFTSSQLMGGNPIIFPLDSSNYSDCLTRAPQRYYYTFVGDPFELTCEPDYLPHDNSTHYVKEPLWYKQNVEVDPEKTNGWSKVINQTGKNFSLPSISTADSGTYLCFLRNACFKVYVLVAQTQNETDCEDAGNCEVLLIQSTADKISCPGIQHFNASARFSVKWYKNKNIFEEYVERVSLKIKNGQIHLGRIYKSDAGIYTCTFKFVENNIKWIVTRSFTVKVIADDTRRPPTVIDPHQLKTIEVELGQSVQLMCKVYFGFARKFNPVIKWLINGKDVTENMKLQQGEVQKTKDSEGFILIRKAYLSKVTEEDFSINFTCFSQNSQGSSSGVLRLKEKESNIFQIKVITISTSLIFVTFVCGCVGVYKFWIEICLLYRHYFVKDETIGDGKEFDAFVSYANTSSLGEDDESNSYIITEEKFALELLPSVLEKQHGYKLCLFERDILPGGVYTEDVISCIKRSRRVIIVLSPNYIARNDSRIFELQTGVSSMLDNYKTKVILIKFHSLPDIVDLPENVKKAITVLPEITWKGNKSFPPSSNFWKMLRYHMPVKKNNIVTSQSFN